MWENKAGEGSTLGLSRRWVRGEEVAAAAARGCAADDEQAAVLRVLAGASGDASCRGRLDASVARRARHSSRPRCCASRVVGIHEVASSAAEGVERPIEGNRSKPTRVKLLG